MRLLPPGGVDTATRPTPFGMGLKVASAGAVSFVVAELEMSTSWISWPAATSTSKEKRRRSPTGARPPTPTVSSQRFWLTPLLNVTSFWSTMPPPMPDSAELCAAVPAVVGEMFSDALLDPSDVGPKVIVTVHVAPTASVAAHVVARANSAALVPVTVWVVMPDRVRLPVLRIVKTYALVEPTFTLPKLCVGRAVVPAVSWMTNEGFAGTPLAERALVSVPALPVATSSWAVFGPEDVGANPTVMVHVAPTASVAVHVVERVNCPLSAPVIDWLFGLVTGTLPVLRRVKVYDEVSVTAVSG